jgi:hypothetical protein
MAINTSSGNPFMSMWQSVAEFAGLTDVAEQNMEGIVEPPEDRPNRLCVCLSDLHLTDGTVGFQNLGINIWESFYDALLQRCKSYHITEVVVIIDGDFVDMIRSSRWAEAKPPIYPWERERKAEFSAVLNQIIKEITDVQHKDFFNLLRNLPQRLEQQAGIKKEHFKLVITIGNHDKELFCDQQALTYFYEQGLGIKVKEISSDERKTLGRMYGDEQMFADVTKAPYLPFYYGDTGFRFFTTHGQWRDQENCAAVIRQNGLPGWSVKDGWNVQKWQQLRYSPFFLPCFGDTVAAGILSTFIYQVKRQLQEVNIEGFEDKKFNRILDELDLYRPTYAAVTRVLDETQKMHDEQRGEEAIKIIEGTLYSCIMQWLDWDFTYQSSPLLRRISFKIAKRAIKLMKALGHGLEIKTIAVIMKSLAHLSKHSQKGESLKEMRKFPAFMAIYRHYDFQIHGEGHTHIPLQEEPNVGAERLSTYINFGTWRDQILLRKDRGYRRRGVLRALFILDLIDESGIAAAAPRSFDYFVEDIIHWGDQKDAMDQRCRGQPKI